MAQSKNRPSDDAIAQRIGEILEAIRTPEHADDIIEIRKIVRKNVPFFFRSYFAAYLLKDSLLGGSKPGFRDRDRNQPKREQRSGDQREVREPRETREQREIREQRETREQLREGGKKGESQESRQKRQEAKPGRQDGARQDGGRQAGPRQESQRQSDEAREERKNERMAPLPEGVEAATLFVSAGRKRHFYPRHLLELFAGADIPRESIGEIRLFDNYTFVQILASDASKAVAGLDGASFKGRKLTVNFARKKDESAEGGDSSRGASLDREEASSSLDDENPPSSGGSAYDGEPLSASEDAAEGEDDFAEGGDDSAEGGDDSAEGGDDSAEGEASFAEGEDDFPEGETAAADGDEAPPADSEGEEPKSGL